MTGSQARTPPLAWLDGHFVPWDEARIHIRTDCVMRGGSVFEGIPGYWNTAAQELYVFRVEDHLARLSNSARILRMRQPYSHNTICDAMLELIRRCGYRQDVHLRPTLYFGEGAAFGYRNDIQVGAFISAVPMPRESRRLEQGIKVAVSSWQRLSDRDQPPRVKASGNYLNSRLAQVQSLADGYDSAILLNSAGHVAETPAACLFIIKNGVAHTPDTTSGILESITRATIIDILGRELGLAVHERAIDRTELYLADEIFECGSAHEVTPIVNVDGYTIGDESPGPVTRGLADLYVKAASGNLEGYRPLLTPVYS